jgi:hypothetical protein
MLACPAIEPAGLEDRHAELKKYNIALRAMDGKSGFRDFESGAAVRIA